MTHEDATAITTLLKSIDEWGWWICFWLIVNTVTR